MRVSEKEGEQVAALSLDSLRLGDVTCNSPPAGSSTSAAKLPQPAPYGDTSQRSGPLPPDLMLEKSSLHMINPLYMRRALKRENRV